MPLLDTFLCFVKLSRGAEGDQGLYVGKALRRYAIQGRRERGQ
jgi:hypothetical protein